MIGKSISNYLDYRELLEKKKVKHCEYCGTPLSEKEIITYDKFTGHPTYIMTKKFCSYCGATALTYTEKSEDKYKRNYK